MNTQDEDNLAKQIIELKGYIKDAALRLRTGLDAQTAASSELVEQLKKLNLNVEKLLRKT
jgi:phage shock protein A